MLFIVNHNLWIFLLIIQQVSAVSYNQPTFCPNSSWNPNGTTVANISTIGSYPYGIFINTNNTIFVPNQDNGQIIVWSEGNLTSTRIISGNLSNPSSLFVTTAGEIYIDAFHSIGGVAKITFNSTIGISRMNKCQQCWDIFINENNTLYCSLSERHQIVAKSLNNDSNLLTIVAGTGTAGSISNMLRNPRGIFVDITLDLYVADCGNDRIQLFQSGKLSATTIVGNGSFNNTITLNCPTDIFLDGNKYPFIVDSGNHRIVGSDANGFRCLVGCNESSGPASSQLSNPWALSFDVYGNIFVSDHGNSRIQKFSWMDNSCAVCNLSCLNGGVCIAVNTCLCTQDVWTGNICQTPVRIFWAFDNNLDDLYNNYQGVGINGPTFNSPGITGYGTCLYLTAAYNQSVTVYSPPFLNMAQTSFSFLAWVKAASFHYSNNGLYTDNAIFGQLQNYTQDHSFHINVRDQNTHFGFWNDDTSGSITLYPGIWYHMAYVYDYSTLTQYIYVNGILDGSGSSKGPYQGTSGDLTIGTNGVGAPTNFWDGCIDQVAYFAYAKSATEVLSDATLTVHYTFDNTSYDSGPLGINGTGTNYAYSSSGRVNQCLSLLTNPSYFQATGLVLLGTSNQSYSFSIWIKPSVTNSGTIIYVSALATGIGWCIPMLGFTSGGAIGVQSWNGSSVSLTGPVVTANVWTYVTVTYSSSNGLRLWVNGTQYGSASAPFSYSAANAPVTVTLGSSFNGTGHCITGGIVMGQYYGYMDEFQLYSRELSATDISNLAHP